MFKNIIIDVKETNKKCLNENYKIYYVIYTIDNKQLLAVNITANSKINLYKQIKKEMDRITFVW